MRRVTSRPDAGTAGRIGGIRLEYPGHVHIDSIRGTALAGLLAPSVSEIQERSTWIKRPSLMNVKWTPASGLVARTVLRPPIDEDPRPRGWASLRGCRKRRLQLGPRDVEAAARGSVHMPSGETHLACVDDERQGEPVQVCDRAQTRQGWVLRGVSVRRPRCEARHWRTQERAIRPGIVRFFRVSLERGLPVTGRRGARVPRAVDPPLRETAARSASNRDRAG